jgi:hypothetical protein
MKEKAETPLSEKTKDLQNTTAFLIQEPSKQTE